MRNGINRVANKEVENNGSGNYSKSSFSIDLILDDYLKLKNALTNDDSKLASEAGKTCKLLYKKAKTDKMKPNYKKQYVSIADAAKQHAVLISENGGN
jgi:hypothetical protein